MNSSGVDSLEQMPVLKGLMDYIKEGNISFHMPGHKDNLREFNELKFIEKNLYKIDKTEVPGLDNLHIPNGIILEGEKRAASLFKVARSYYLVNGSTCGIYGMIMGMTKPGDKIIVQRNCHISVFMACMMGDLNPVYINPEISIEFGIAVSLDVEKVIKIMDENRDARAIVITYPTYYGTCCDLEKISEEAHKRNILVLVDEAHGAHLYFSERLPNGAMEMGADLAVTSLHKTTPSLTQTALLNVKEGIETSGVEFMLRVFQSTSPSYVLMASMDAARYIMETRGRGLLEELLNNIKTFRNKVSELKGYRILGRNHINCNSIFDLDETKLVINSPLKGKVLDERLRKEWGIQVEMSDANNIVALCSLGNMGDSLDRLYKALLSYENSDCRGEKTFYMMPSYEKAINMKDAYYKEKRIVKLLDAVGMISSEMVAPYPPGIPILLPGEVITKEIIEAILFYKSKGIDINGISDKNGEYIKVIKN